jgi:hypothetical protein
MYTKKEMKENKNYRIIGRGRTWKKSSGGYEEFHLLPTYFMLVYYVAYSSTLKIEATYFSETYVNFQRTIRCYIPDDRTFQYVFSWFL